MKSLLIAIALFSTGLVTGQTKDKVDQITVDIRPHKELSYGAFFKSLTLSSTDRGVEYIGGFNFEWGYTYSLKLKRTKLANPPQDVGDTDYDLIKVVSKTRVPDSTTFTLRLDGYQQLGRPMESDDGAIQFNADGVCTYMRSMNFKCTKAQKKKLLALNKTDTSKKGTFMFVGKEIHLVSMK